MAAFAGSCVKELDADGRVIEVNKKCVELFEAESQDQLLGKRWTELWPPSLRTTVEEALSKAKRGEVAQFEGDAPTLRGNVRSWQVEVTPSPPGGNPKHFLVLRHDVTVLKQANTALATLNAALRNEVGTHRHDADTASNRYKDALLRLSEQESRNTTTLASLNLLRTRLRSAEKDLDLANAATLVAETAILRAQQERVISHVIGGVAHDLNNMVASIIMSLCMIQDHLDDPSPKLLQFLQYATEGSEQAAKLSKRLMAFTRVHEIVLTEIDLGEVVEDIFAFVAHSLGGRAHLNWIRAPGQHPVIADLHLIQQALLNLCINARHASPEGGIIDIRLETMTNEQGSINEPPGTYVTLSVTDHGTGMTEEVQSRLFEPFFTTKEEGSGLGLAQVYGLMKQVGGFVHVDSTLGCGTTVLLAFPRPKQSILSADRAIVDARP